MERKILILKNITHEGGGILDNLLKEKNIAVDTIDLKKGEKIPSLQGYSALVVLGGPDSANDNTEKMIKELEAVKKALSGHLPYIGICLGMQALVKAAGGKVMRSPVAEVGFRDREGEFFKVQLTDEGRKDLLFNGLDDEFKVFQLHGETVELSTGIKLLGKGKYCKNQVVKAGDNAYGLQCHFELTPDMFEYWINKDRELLKLNKEELRSDFSALKKEYTETGYKLFENFLKIAGF